MITPCIAHVTVIEPGWRKSRAGRHTSARLVATHRGIDKAEATSGPVSQESKHESTIECGEIELIDPVHT
jgi:hypothetical protein